jgi:hypothetical protein
MKRITIVAVLALFSAVASTGCLGQTSSGESTDESNLVSQSATQAPNEEQRTAQYNGGPAITLELKTHPNDEGQGPHPEPWLDQEGPHPEPWSGRKLIILDPHPNNGSGTKP